MSVLRAQGDELVWDLRVDEHALLVMMLSELDHALDAPTDDPVVQRLFPAAVEGDDDEDAELRMLIAGDLLLQRHEAIRQMLSVLDRAVADGVGPSTELLTEAGRDADPDALPRYPVPLREDEPGTMLAIMNDVRLALAARVGLTAIELPQLIEPDDARTHGLLEIMDALAYFQMQLLRHIDPTSVAYADPDGDDSQD